MQGVVILGSTGSIGKKTLEVIAWHPEQYQVVALVAHRNVDEIFVQCKQARPRYVILKEKQAAFELQNRLHQNQINSVEVYSGEDVIEHIVSLPEVQVVVAAITGAAGLMPTLAAISAGKRVLLANKESLVMAGDLITKAVVAHHAELIPIDSEHHALFQCLHTYQVGNGPPKGVKKMILTASGGPFRTWERTALNQVTPEQACLHPIWSMGRKISVDSATLMNKGLEVIEAHGLFRMAPEKIEVLIHPQSIVHGLLEYENGTFMAQLCKPDMLIPIASALNWPEHLSIPVESLDLARVAKLTFEPVDHQRFPCLRLAYQALEMGSGAATVLNAANEVAVQFFLQGKIGFMDIPRVITSVLEKMGAPSANDVDTVLSIDHLARQEAMRWIHV